MPSIIILPDKRAVQIRLSLVERIFALKSMLTVMCEDIEDVHVDGSTPLPLHKILGLAMGKVFIGTFQTDAGLGFYVVKKWRSESMLVIRMRRGRYRVIVLELDSPETATKVADEISRVCQQGIK